MRLVLILGDAERWHLQHCLIASMVGSCFGQCQGLLVQLNIRSPGFGGQDSTVALRRRLRHWSASGTNQVLARDNGECGHLGNFMSPFSKEWRRGALNTRQWMT
ncbi:hypothetical protein BDU57DRAFT_286111 [Ampelomyces quisqualis]|uniref:Uncharacterized protein n=1 Tax=Ampelomyces quisqualis TaxID=50730 RepID=A0A6A5QJG2_AMPQU|nr:hypothetical protein BDU57DRAFT_286111 [Ampelomyces quisqualis]